MKFFIDTANLKDIKKGISIGVVDGVTTNPSLMGQENITNHKSINEHYKKICEMIDGDVSVEVISNNYHDMISEGVLLSKIHKNIIVKVPMGLDGIKAIKFFTDNNIKTNCTLVFSVSQALLASKVGATYISPFIGRLDDIDNDGLNLIKDIKIAYSNYNVKTKILAASIRSGLHISKCSLIGVDCITSPLKHILSLFNHPLTDIGIKKFENDFNRYINK
ncbi:MAG: fructose-6-phosphate aldolase [Bacteroides sp.]|nr:MAG: fructose-6-phosphate aldolase [Bacteroides sp.]